MAGKGNKELVDALNLDRAFELSAIIQYMGHHYEAVGIESPAVADLFKKNAIDEMKHAEAIAERIAYLGGVPIQKPTPVKRGGSLKEMVKDDLAAEVGAIERYKKHIKLCEKLGDSTTRRMLEKILSEEEGHADDWKTILEKR